MGVVDVLVFRVAHSIYSIETLGMVSELIDFNPREEIGIRAIPLLHVRTASQGLTGFNMSCG